MKRDLCRYCRHPLATKEDVERESDEPGLCWSIVDYCETDAETAIDAHLATIARLERELAELTQSLDFQTQLNREVIEREKQTFAELSAERELADRLALELRWRVAAGGYGAEQGRESLAAWKGARNETR